MKNTWIRSLTLTAVALTLGTAAYAQTRMTATVPFSFRINGTVLPAGEYAIGTLSTSNISVVKIADRSHKNAAFALASSGVQGKSEEPRLVFRCGDVMGCTLIQAWDDNGYGWEFQKPRLAPTEKGLLAVVPLHRASAD
jgi:hypothetical protein